MTEWVGFEVKNHGATDGVAIGECWLYDEEGPIDPAAVATDEIAAEAAARVAATAKSHLQARRMRLRVAEAEAV